MRLAGDVCVFQTNTTVGPCIGVWGIVATLGLAILQFKITPRAILGPLAKVCINRAIVFDLDRPVAKLRRSLGGRTLLPTEPVVLGFGQL